MCDTNDYSLLTANTGIAAINTGNNSLLGVDATLILSGAENGTMVRSVIIKNVDNDFLRAPLLTGMVRLFVGPTVAVDPSKPNRSLYREIPIPTYPDLSCIPYPIPTFPKLEIDLITGLKIQDGYSLYASTQVSNTFNIIAQGVDIAYPATLPATCCNFKQETVITGVNSVSVANPDVDGGGDIEPLYTVGTAANGAVIKSITVAALGSTHPGMVRFFISPDAGTTYYLWMECSIPESIQSGFTPSLKRVLEEDFYLQADYIIAASTQNAESFAITVEGEEWTYPIS